jgi:putative ABC transport system ATP-binding protein|tara:strand:+ start:8474 stop:9133 length:660 start_codon:yes stop_codon:yes gene_type:complete
MILQTKDVRKEVLSGNAPLVILDGINLSLEEGKSLAIVGPSGSGKSTLLGILAGLDTASSGEVYLNKIALHDLDEEQRAGVRKDNVAFVFQSFELLPGLTALENVMLPAELKLSDRAKEKATEYLERVGLTDRLDHYPRQLSGGEQQRVAIARAFACEAKLLFADEPTGNLDPKTGQTVSELLFEVNAETANALIVVTHDLELAKKCDYQIDLMEGKII